MLTLIIIIVLIILYVAIGIFLQPFFYRCGNDDDLATFLAVIWIITLFVFIIDLIVKKIYNLLFKKTVNKIYEFGIKISSRLQGDIK